MLLEILVSMVCTGWSLFRWFSVSSLLGDEQSEHIPPTVEVPFHGDADALGRQGGFGEVAVVGLAVGFQTHVPVSCQQPLQVEISDEVSVRGGLVVAVTEIAIDEQAVVEQAS